LVIRSVFPILKTILEIEEMPALATHTHTHTHTQGRVQGSLSTEKEEKKNE
jgi:hypothetical protein